MQIKLLTDSELRQVYENEMRRDFPEDELKPYSAIEQMMHSGIYEPLSFWDEHGNLQAYALQTVLPGCKNALLDYFAVTALLRGTGIGSAALNALTQYYAPRLDSLIIECEHPAGAPDKTEAKRRIGFYLRAGAHPAAMESLVYGVRYQIYALPCGGNPTDKAIQEDLETIYRTMVPEPYYRGNVVFFGM